MSKRAGIASFAVALVMAAMPARADSVSTESTNGYGRILFTLDPPAHAKTELSGAVLTITFDRKPDISPNAILQGLSAYLGSVRNDGLVYRLALSQNVRLHTTVSAGRIAIDLVPDGFAGMPPDLPPPPPKETQAVDVNRLAPLKIHAGAYASYSRLVFDWPRNVPYAVFPGAGHIAIRFEALARPDFSGFENVSPPWVKEAGWRIENRGTVIDFETDPQSGFHDSRTGTNIVLDILAPKADAAAYAPRGNDGRTVSRPEPVAAERPQQTPPANAQAKAIADASAQLNAKAPALSQPAANATQPDPKAAAAAPNPAAAAPTRTATSPAQVQAAAQAMRTPAGVILNFPGAGTSPAVVFIRGMTAWIVIDGTQKIDAAQMKSALGDFPTAVDVSIGNGATVIRIGLKREEEISARVNGSNLRVDIGPHEMGMAEAVDFVRDESNSQQTRLTTLIPGAVHALTLPDPEAGDCVIVIPGIPGRAVIDAHRYAEFAVLPTASGLAVEPYAEDLMATVSVGHVTISRPAGLAMTQAPAVAAQSPSGLVRGTTSAAFLDFANWSSTEGKSFLGVVRRLRAHIAAERSEDANHARLALARFYLANRFAAEALGLINQIQTSDPSLQGDMQLETMRAAADYMMGRYRDAHNEIGSGAFDNDRHAAFWRGLIEAALENWDGARKSLAMAAPVLRRYPPEWQARALLAEADTALAAGGVETADNALARLPRNLARDLALEAQYERGRLLAGEGRSHDARAIFSDLELSGNERLAAEAIYADTDAGLSDGSMTRDQAIAALERLRFRWRGDALELRTLRRLGALYFGKKSWRDGLVTLRIASQNFPNAELARQAQDDMRTTFVNLFLRGKADSLPPIQALSLFYDFIDLTPIGPDGDEMIRRMSDRLAAVDLLGPAETLLDYQITKRLDGFARAQVATRLAMIDMLDHKPKDALSTLRETEIAGLPDDVNHARVLLEAQALAALKQWDQALDLIAVDEAPDTRRLRADIYWESGNWPLAAQKAEELVADRGSDAASLTPDDRREVMRAAIAYSLASDEPGLERLRTRYAAKMKNSSDASAFAVVTQNIDLQGVAFRDLAGKIASVDTFEEFMQDFRKRFDAAKRLN